MVLLIDLLGAGKLEKVRSGGCEIAEGCDCVCMLLESQEEMMVLFVLGATKDKHKFAFTSNARPRALSGPTRLDA